VPKVIYDSVCVLVEKFDATAAQNTKQERDHARTTQNLRFKLDTVSKTLDELNNFSR